MSAGRLTVAMFYVRKGQPAFDNGVARVRAPFAQRSSCSNGIVICQCVLLSPSRS